MTIPTIDFSIYNESDHSSIAFLAQQIEHACSNIGFFALENLGIDNELMNDIFATSKAFFTSSQQDKNKLAYTDAAANFGYQCIGQEKLTPSGEADLKESLTMRDLLNNPDANLMDENFRKLSIDFYQAAMLKTYQIQRVFAYILQVENDYFEKRHKGYCTSLRMLYYPTVTAHKNAQFGAGEHTDYGMITLLFQDDVGGLQVKDRQGTWLNVPADPSKVVVNCGDLLERWTNGRFLSTTHRVLPNLSKKPRQSIALFIDPDPDVEIECLPSCCSDEKPAKYPMITAGEFIQQKILATHI